MLAGLLRNLGEGVSISHCSDLHAIAFIWSKPLQGKRPTCSLIYSSSSANLPCWMQRSSHSPMSSELQHLRFLPNSSLLKRFLTCLWKSLFNSSARKAAIDLQILRKQPISCRQLQEIPIVWISVCMSLLQSQSPHPSP